MRFFHFPFGLCVLWEDIQIILKAVMFLFSEGIVDHRQRCLSRVPLEVLLHPLQENAISVRSQVYKAGAALQTVQKPEGIAATSFLPKCCVLHYHVSFPPLAQVAEASWREH